MELWPEAVDDGRVVIVHPHYRRPLHLLYRLLEEPDAVPVKVQRGWSFENIQEEFAAELAGAATIILEDLDYMDPAEQGRALRELAASANTLVVFTREVQQSWFRDPALRERIVLHDDLAEDVPVQEVQRPRLDVFSFGRGEVFIDGQPIMDWDGGLSRMLFLFMVHRRFATREEILRAIWPELESGAAMNVFHVSKNRLKQVFGAPPLHFERGRYHLSLPMRLHYDVQHFYDLLQPITAENEAERMLRLLRAQRVARQEFLLGSDLPWVHAARRTVQRSRRRMFEDLSNGFAMQREYDPALGFAQRALAMHGRSPRLLMHFLRLHLRRGTPCEGLSIVKRLVEKHAGQGDDWQRLLSLMNAMSDACE